VLELRAFATAVLRTFTTDSASTVTCGTDGAFSAATVVAAQNMASAVIAHARTARSLFTG
jgi:hypothetical protein